MTRIGILKITLAVTLVFLICMSFAPQWTAVNPLIPSVAADSNDADDDSIRENLPPASISVTVDMVTMQVLVSDNNGNVITGLRPENFTIYEDGVKQEISHFSPMEANVTVVMLVEFSRRNEIFLGEVYNAMYEFARTLRPGDWTAVVGYDMRTTIFSDFTQNRHEVYQALRQFTFPSWDESNLHDAVIDVIDRTQELEGKVAILLISSGLHTFGRSTFEQALNAARNANASIYSIGIGGFVRTILDSRGRLGPSTRMDFQVADNRLRSFSDLTGGAAFFPRFSTELPGIFRDISTALRSQYSIGYVSTNTERDGRFRNVRVEVQTDLKDRRGNPIRPKVVTRRGYTAGRN
jgi:VWFA-related protein